MNRPRSSELTAVATALRGLQRSAFSAVVITGFRVGGLSTWLAAASTVLWLIVLWWAVALVRSLPHGSLRQPAMALAVGLVVVGVLATIDGLRWSENGFGDPSWARPAGVLLTLPWVWLLRHLALYSGIEPFVTDSERVVRRTRWLFVFVAGAAALAAVIELTTDGEAALLPITVMVLVTFVWQVRLWIFTRELWQAFGPHPSSLSDDPPATATVEPH